MALAKIKRWFKSKGSTYRGYPAKIAENLDNAINYIGDFLSKDGIESELDFDDFTGSLSYGEEKDVAIGKIYSTVLYSHYQWLSDDYSVYCLRFKLYKNGVYTTFKNVATNAPTNVYKAAYITYVGEYNGNEGFLLSYRDNGWMSGATQLPDHIIFKLYRIINDVITEVNSVYVNGDVGEFDAELYKPSIDVQGDAIYLYSINHINAQQNQVKLNIQTGAVSSTVQGDASGDVYVIGSTLYVNHSSAIKYGVFTRNFKHR